MSQPTIDTTNRCLVSAPLGAGSLRILRPLPLLSPNEALVHAAWLVVLAETGADFTFAEALEAVKNT